MVRILLVACLTACWRGDAPVVALPIAAPVRAAVAEMTLDDATALLAKLPPRDRAVLQELWYMYDLQDVIGDEEDAERLMRRFEQELAAPRVLDPAAAKGALARSQKVLANVLASNLGKYEKSDLVAAPVLEIILAPPEIERRILAFPADVSTAWFLTQYASKAHYHVYRMHNRMFDLLAAHGGRRTLSVIEERLRTAIGDGDGIAQAEDWRVVVRTARRILGADFSRWYGRVFNRSYADDRARVPEQRD